MIRFLFKLRMGTTRKHKSYLLNLLPFICVIKLYHNKQNFCATVQKNNVSNKTKNNRSRSVKRIDKFMFIKIMFERKYLPNGKLKTKEAASGHPRCTSLQKVDKRFYQTNRIFQTNLYNNRKRSTLQSYYRLDDHKI